MKNTKKALVLKIVALVWIIFASLYVVFGEYNRLSVYVAQTSYAQGFQDSVVQLMTEASKCEPFNVTFVDQKVNLMNLDCVPPEGGDPQAAAQNSQVPEPNTEVPALNTE